MKECSSPAAIGRVGVRLKSIQDWTEMARAAKWSASALAKKCGVSLRTLDRHFKATTGTTPKQWLAEQRQHQAIDLLKRGCSVKEAASVLGYKHPHNFSRKFKEFWGRYPTEQTELLSQHPLIVAK